MLSGVRHLKVKGGLCKFNLRIGQRDRAARADADSCLKRVHPTIFGHSGILEGFLFAPDRARARARGALQGL